MWRLSTSLQKSRRFFRRIRGCPVLTVVWRWTTSVKQVVLAVIDYEEVRPAVIVEIEETDL